jgi:hypothetical protein
MRLGNVTQVGKCQFLNIWDRVAKDDFLGLCGFRHASFVDVARFFLNPLGFGFAVRVFSVANSREATYVIPKLNPATWTMSSSAVE